MKHANRLFCTFVIWAVMSGAAMACAYPTSFRIVNNAMNDQIIRGGEVSMFVRNKLRRALDHMPPDAMLDSMSGDVARGDLRAARRVLAAADALADGRGFKVDPDLRSDTMRLREAAQQDCANGTLEGNGNGAADGVDGGGERKAVGASSGLTFKEGMTRLSITFTLYAIFLVGLFTFRQYYSNRFDTPKSEDDDDATLPTPTLTPPANLLRDP